SRVVGVDAAARGVAAVVGADVAVVAVERSAADAGVVHAGLEAITDVAVVAVPIGGAAPWDGLVHAPRSRVAEVIRAGRTVIAGGRGPGLKARGGIGGLGAAAGGAVAALERGR